ncbi:MAG: prepilin-type N-terminal cleavage/methylation domain-containing protein [Kiritimatiellae bacterium]|nr:prepilin-type N-terminal cleavage/methylation domain-containing protein [Kiritimatiellia bacterium]
MRVVFKKGFTLVELLTVMAIMAMLSTIAVSSYFTAIRGMARRSALKHLANTFVLARQRACMEGASMSVMIFNEITGYDNTEASTGSGTSFNPTYVICRKLGRISCLPDNGSGKGDHLVDEFLSLDVLFGSILDENETNYKRDHELESFRLYNLTRGKWSDVYPKVVEELLDNRTSSAKGSESFSDQKKYKHDLPVYAFIVQNQNSVNWRVCDAYGIEVSPPNTLPRGFIFPDLNEDKEEDVITVTFNPDGTCSGDRTIRLQEVAGGKTTSIKLNANGDVTWDQRPGAWK